MLYPMLVNGVPVAFEQTEDALSVYLNTELLLPFFIVIFIFVFHLRLPEQSFFIFYYN